jgi:hypothetical protein
MGLGNRITAKNPWIINPKVDISVFIATPLFIIPLSFWLPLFIPWGVIKIIVLAISASGHHLPGFIRAYTDPNVFHRFRYRLIIVPAIFVVLSVTAAWLKLTFIYFVLIFWGTWHGSMQILGFLRIYDLKAGFKSDWTARIDYWLCLTWFVQVILWSVAKKASLISYFYLSGGPILATQGAKAFEEVWLALTILTSLAWLFMIVYNATKHRYFNLPKTLCTLSSIGFWAYCLISVHNLLIGVILWEIFHDLQYNVFVWSYNHNRVEQNLSRSALERFLFRWDAKRIALYSLCIIAYGCLSLFSQDFISIYENKRFFSSFLVQIGSVFGASALCHFYMDGFIWKLRDGKVQRDLGIQSGGEYKNRSELRHWILMGTFCIGCIALATSEYKQRKLGEVYKGDNLAELVPRSGYANFTKASQLQARGDLDSAVIFYEQAIQNDTNYSFTHALIGELKLQQGEYIGAISHLEIARVIDTDNGAITEKLTQAYFQQAFAFLQAKNGNKAKPYLIKSLELNPNNPPGWNYLAMIEHASGNRSVAREYYLKALKLDSNYSMAKDNLSRLEANK